MKVNLFEHGKSADIGERVYNLQRMINVREGIGRVDDQLPERARKMPEFGPYSSVAECEIKNYEQMLDEYYKARGWSSRPEYLEHILPLQRLTSLVDCAI